MVGMTSEAQRAALSDDSVVIDRVILYLHVFMIYILLSYPSLVGALAQTWEAR